MPDGAIGRFGPIDQIAYVVRDMVSSLPAYEAIFGPFTVSDSPLDACETPNGLVDCELRLAVNDAGPVEIELIEVLSGRPPHSDHLDAHGEGLHHVRFRVDSLDAALADLEAEGCTCLFKKRFAPTIAFAYVETPEIMGASVVELLELAM